MVLFVLLMLSLLSNHAHMVKLDQVCDKVQER